MKSFHQSKIESGTGQCRKQAQGAMGRKGQNMAMKYRFPDNFWWGAATSGPQSEGRFHKLHRNVFDYWFGTEPQAFFQGVGPDIASNFYNSYGRKVSNWDSLHLHPHFSFTHQFLFCESVTSSLALALCLCNSIFTTIY